MTQVHKAQKIFLFDWGDTLMRDFADASGKMCDWYKVEAVDGAFEVLQKLSQQYPVYVATNAAESQELEIRHAFDRVDLARFIRGYFCKANLGIDKNHPQFYSSIARELDVEPENLIMVGDTLDKDILPAVESGLNAVWFNHRQQEAKITGGYEQITHLSQLLSVACD